MAICGERSAHFGAQLVCKNFSECVSSLFRLPRLREEAFLIAIHAPGAIFSVEIGKIPNHMTREVVVQKG